MGRFFNDRWGRVKPSLGLGLAIEVDILALQKSLRGATVLGSSNILVEGNLTTLYSLSG